MMSPGEATTSPREATTSPAGPRIYWLTTEFYPPETGGTGMIAARLAHGLGERGLGVQIITRQVLPPSARSESIGTIQVRRVDPPGRMKGAGWRAVPAMLSFIVRVAAILCLETRRYDIVMVSGMKTLPITAVPVSRLLGKRCVIRVESPFELVEPISAESLQMMHGMLGRCMSGLLRRMQQAVLRRATCVIAISQDIEERLAQSKHPPARIVRIPNAVDLSKFTPVTEEQKARLRDRLGYPAGRTIVLYVGRLSRAKGVMNLIEGWPELMGKFPSAHLARSSPRVPHHDGRAQRCGERASAGGRSVRVAERLRGILADPGGGSRLRHSGGEHRRRRRARIHTHRRERLSVRAPGPAIVERGARARP
jgi:glycosyltransferase involved in cell wall biosynthesis